MPIITGSGPELRYSSFDSEIGRIFYIWLKKSRNLSVLSGNINITGDNYNTSGKEENNGIFAVFLSNSGNSFSEYMKKLRLKYPDITFSDNKSEEIESSILDYLKGKKREINLEYQFLTGSIFEKKIWEAASLVAYGSVASYMEIAEIAGYDRAWRAAGTALGKNPLMLIIPCHRIIKSSGHAGFFGGGEKVKEFLLDLESSCLLLRQGKKPCGK